MRINDLIKKLQDYKKRNGNVELLEVKIIYPTYGDRSYLNSVKDNNKKMTIKEYVDLCKKGHFGKANQEVENESR